jgi:hypothetical protein
MQDREDVFDLLDTSFSAPRATWVAVVICG